MKRLGLQEFFGEYHAASSISATIASDRGIMNVSRHLDVFCALILPSDPDGNSRECLDSLMSAIEQALIGDDQIRLSLITRAELESSLQKVKAPSPEMLAEALEKRVREEMRKCLLPFKSTGAPCGELAKYHFALVGFPASVEEAEALLRRDGALLEAVMLLSTKDVLPVVVPNPSDTTRISKCQTMSVAPENGKSLQEAKEGATSALFSALLAEQAAGKPGSRDLTFAQFRALTRRGFARRGREVLHDIVPVLRWQSAAKKNYRTWLQTLRAVPVPERGTLDIPDLIRIARASMLDPSHDSLSGWDQAPLAAAYRELVSEILHPSVATVLFCIEEAVLRQAGCSSATPPKGLAQIAGKQCIEIPYGDHAAYRALCAACMVEEALTGSDLQTNWEDTCLQVTLERAMLRRLVIPRCFGAGSIPIEEPYTSWQNGVRSSETQSFGCFGPVAMRQTRLRAALDEVLQALPRDSPKGFRSSDRRAMEPLPGHVLSQRLREILMHHPDVYRKYVPEDDALVLVCHIPTPQKRQQRYVWRADEHMRTEPRFDRFRTVGKDHALTPRFRAAVHARIEDPQECMGKVLYTADTVFPADRSRISVHGDRNRQRWISGEVDDKTIGLQRGIFFLDASGTRVTSQRVQTEHEKPDGYGYMTLTHTFPSGLCVEHSSAGEVTMRYLAKCRRSLGPGGREELRRVVTSLGCITIYWRSGGYRILFPQGGVLDVDKPSETRRFCAVDGVLWEKHSGGDWTAVRKDPVVEVTDPGTAATIRTLDSGICIVTYPSGDRAVRHTDGTAMTFCKRSDLLLLSARGFPPVEMDMAVQAQAVQHVHGGKTSISKAGKQARLRTILPDGNEVTISYDSRITAPVNGEIRCVSRDLSEVTVCDDGSVVYTPRRLGRRASDCQEDTRPAEAHGIDSIGRYRFNLDKEELRVDDEASNEFHVSLSKTKVNLSGEVEGIPAKAVMSTPIEPRAFIVFRKGDGVEVLPEPMREDFVNQIPKIDTACMRRERSVSLAPELPKVREQEYSLSTSFAGKHPNIFSNVWTEWQVPEGLEYFLPRCVRWENAKLRRRTREIRVVRKLQVHSFASVKVEEGVLASIQNWIAWRNSRAHEINRFAISDPRSEDFRQHEAALRKELQKSYKAAKAARKREKERRRHQHHQVERALSAIKESDDQETAGPEEDEGDDFEFSESEDGDAEEGTNQLFEECVEACHAFGEADGVLRRFQVRAALIQVLGVGVSEGRIQTIVRETSGSVPSDAPFDAQDLYYLVLSLRDAERESQSTAAASHSASPKPKRQDIPRTLRPGSFWDFEDTASNKEPNNARTEDMLWLSRSSPKSQRIKGRQRAVEQSPRSEVEC
eukprot:scaffold1472_cov300-Pinguiococcus_pyrenoidosus.AAC.4